jgi:hypothetical protein
MTMTDGTPHPMPDMKMLVLPGRAYLLSVQDQSLLMRRAALLDARAEFDATEGDGFEKRLALVGLIGDAIQLVEDVAALSNSWFNSPPGVGFFATAASYEPNAINRFYDGLHKRPSEDFLALAALCVDGHWIHDSLLLETPLSDEERQATERAHVATAKLIQGHLMHLRDQWRQFRRYFHAFKHGMLVADPRDVEVTDDRNDAVDQLVVWMRRTSVPIGYGSITPPFEAIADWAQRVGNLAADVTEHLAQTRLKMLDFMRLERGGAWSAQSASSAPWLWWFHAADVPEVDQQLLTARYGMTFEDSQ